MFTSLICRDLWICRSTYCSFKTKKNTVYCLGQLLMAEVGGVCYNRFIIVVIIQVHLKYVSTFLPLPLCPFSPFYFLMIIHFKNCYNCNFSFVVPKLIKMYLLKINNYFVWIQTVGLLYIFLYYFTLSFLNSFFHVVCKTLFPLLKPFRFQVDSVVLTMLFSLSVVHFLLVLCRWCL